MDMQRCRAPPPEEMPQAIMNKKKQKKQKAPPRTGSPTAKTKHDISIEVRVAEKYATRHRVIVAFARDIAVVPVCCFRCCCGLQAVSRNQPTVPGVMIWLWLICDLWCGCVLRSRSIYIQIYIYSMYVYILLYISIQQWYRSTSKNRVANHQDEHISIKDWMTEKAIWCQVSWIRHVRSGYLLQLLLFPVSMLRIQVVRRNQPTGAGCD